MGADLDRRGLLTGAAVASAAALAAGCGERPKRRTGLRATAAGHGFPAGFLWGTATSSYQIEGAWNEGGKGPSIWDTYAHTPGKVRNGDTGDVADDHYHRYREDVALMRGIGQSAYRFSISWPRVFPTGRGAANPKGIGFYDRLVDELLAAGVQPFPTYYHWELPQALQDAGGWRSRDVAQAFADYAGYLTGKLGDRVKHVSTLNEIRNFTAGYGGAEGAPGLSLPPGELNQVRHNAVLAHGLAVQAIHAAGKGVQCGPAEVLVGAVPLIETPDNVRAAMAATRELNAPFLTVMLEGRYTDDYLEAAGADAPQVRAGDLKTISEPNDFVGINVYKPGMYVLAADVEPHWREAPISKSHPKMFSNWQVLGPESLYWGPKIVEALWKPRSIYITENGCAAADEIAPDGQVYDTDRIMYLRASLTELQRATSEGVPVDGYFLWSTMDNFEWIAGYGDRFGIVYVDFETQKRTPKQSAAWFREAARRNAVV